MVEVGEPATSANPEGKGRGPIHYGDYTPRPGRVKKLAKILANKQSTKQSTKRIPSPEMIVSKKSCETEEVEKMISAKLREIMKSLNLDTATPKEVSP